jgi:hypothetical protein
MSRFSITIIAWALSVSASFGAEITAFPLKSANEGGIIISGELKAADHEEFLIKAAPYSGGIVFLDSPGGISQAGIDIGRAVRMRNFITYVPSGSTCASACAMIWLGGSKRLVGKTGRVGFHSVYRIENGIPVEAGSGNAVYGAYLSQLGLSDKAIRYLSSANPASMSWLTPELADLLDIKMAVFEFPDDKPATASRSTPQEPKTTGRVPFDTLEKRAKDFVLALNVLISGSADKLTSVLPGLYSNEVAYFGKAISRDEVIGQISAFLSRWPTRAYSARPDSFKFDCNELINKCRVEGLLDFDARSFDRNQRSHGVATFEYLLEFRPNARWPIISAENGKVVSRQVEAINERSPSPQNKSLFSIR